MSHGFRRGYPARIRRPSLLVALSVVLGLAQGAWGQTAPSVTGVTLNRPADSDGFRVGEQIEAQVNFSEAVWVFEGDVGGVQTGELALRLSIGANDRRAEYCGGSGSQNLDFCYTVVRGDEDDDGISIGPLVRALVGGAILSAGGTVAGRDHPAQGPFADRVVDGLNPRIDQVRITSTPNTPQTYGAGEAIEVALTFDEVVNVTEVDSQAELLLQVGTNIRRAAFHAGSGTDVLTYRYIVRAGDRDRDGINIGPGPTSLTGGVITDLAGNVALRDFTGLAQDADHQVDGGMDVAAPAVVPGGVRVTSAATTYITGATIEVTATFDEDVIVTGNPTLALRIGAANQNATYDRGSGTALLVFRYKVMSGDRDDNGISIGENALALNGGTITDRTGNNAALSFQAPGRQPGQLVNAVAPVVTRVGFSGTPRAGTTYRAGETVRAEVEFDVDVDVVGTPGLLLSIGTVPARRMTFAGASARTLFFTYTVRPGDQDTTDGIEIAAGSMTLIGGIIRDRIGNDANRTINTAVGPDVSRLVDGGVDSVAPTVEDVSVTSNPRIHQTYAMGDTYATGDRIEIAVRFSEPVNRTGTAEVAISVDGGTVQAAYATGTGTDTLTFRYNVVAGVVDADGISIGTNALTVTGGTIADFASNDAELDLPAVALQAGHKIEAVAPTVTSEIRSRPAAGSSYVANETIRVRAEFDEPVCLGTGTPVMRLVVGFSNRQMRLIEDVRCGQDRFATVFAFEYRVNPGEMDTNGVSVESLSGPFVDRFGNPAEFTGAVINDDPAHQVDGGRDTEAPTVAAVEVSSPSERNALEISAMGDRIEVLVTFTEVVFVINAPTVGLAIGAQNHDAQYEGGSGTRVLRFSYQVGPHDADDVITVRANSLALPPGGAILDAAGNHADRAFAETTQQAPAGTVDGVTPTVATVAITSGPGTDRTYKRGDVLAVTLTMSEPVCVRHAPSLTLALGIGARTRDARLQTTTNCDDRNRLTRALVFTYAVQDGDRALGGIEIQSGAVLGGTVADYAGNDADMGGAVLPPQNQHRVDGVAPGAAVAIISDPGEDRTYVAGDEIRVRVTFDETLSASAAQGARLALTIGDLARQATLVDTRPNQLTFVYRVRQGDQDDDGISVRANALVGGSFTNRTLLPIVNDGRHLVDTELPFVTEVRIVSSPRSGDSYGVEEVIRVDVVFNEEVWATANPRLRIDMDQRKPAAGLVRGSGTRTLRFQYQVQPGDSDTDGIAIDAAALIDGTILDSAGNEAVRRLQPLPAQRGHKVASSTDDQAPFIVDLRITSTPAVGVIYAPGEVVEVQVVFSEAVNVAEVCSVAGQLTECERPVLQLAVGDVSRSARIDPEDDASDTLTFRYTIVEGDFDADGISIPANALTGGTIRDYADGGNVADRAHAALPANGFQRVDGVPPRTSRALEIVSNPRGSCPRGYGLGDTIKVKVKFDEFVVVSGQPTLRLSIGREDREAIFAEVNREDFSAEFHYVVRVGDRDDDGISIGPDALRGGGIQDLVGNTWSVGRLPGLASDGRRHCVNGGSDFLPPVVKSVRFDSPRDPAGYRLYEAIDVYVVFSEPVNVVGGTPAVLIAIGSETRRATYLTGSGRAQLNFRYIVQLEDYDRDGISIGPNALVGGEIQDQAGNDAVRAFFGLPQDGTRKVNASADVDAPAVERVAVTPRADGGDTHGIGDIIEVRVDFDEPVVVGDGARPAVRISVGANARRAAYANGSGTESLVFRYTVQPGDWDADGIDIAPDALVGGEIQDEGGNDALRHFAGPRPVGPQLDHKVDARRPAAERLAIISTAPDGGYALADVIRVRVEFNEAVWVGGDPALTLSIGAASRPASYNGGSGTNRLIFEYEVQAGDYDQDGISIGPNALVGGTIEDRAGNAWGPAERRLDPLPNQPRHTVDSGVDAIVPRVTDVRITSTPLRGAYRLGERIEVMAWFTEPVWVTEGAPVLMVSIGGALRPAALVGGGGTNRLVFEYVVQPGDLEDRDGISIGRGPASLAGGRIEDVAGNEANRTFDAVLADQYQKVDARRPAADGVTVVSTAEAGDVYGRGEVIELRVRFTEPVWVVADDSGPVLRLGVGRQTVDAEYIDGSGTEVLRFRYVVRTGDYAPAGISVGADALRGGVIEDSAGNDWPENLRKLPQPRRYPDHKINSGTDIDRPIVQNDGVRITSRPPRADDTYGLGDVITVEISFTEVVHVMGQPTLALSIGPAVRQALYATGSGNTVLKFEYTVQAGDLDTDGVSVGPGPDSLAGGAIRDEGGNGAIRDFGALRPANRHKVDAVPPRVTGPPSIVTSPEDGDTYALDEDIDLELRFDDAVRVVGDLALNVRVGAEDRRAELRTGTGTRALTFRYTVQKGDFDDDGVSVPASGLVGGDVEDVYGNIADRAVPPLEDQAKHKVDGIDPPTVQSVRIMSDPMASEDTYGMGETIKVDIVFTEPVHVSGQPALALSIGPAVRQAPYSTGSGTETLTFEYTVQAGDLDEDGVSVGPGPESLAGGTIRDVDGNDAVRDFPPLAEDGEHKVDAVPPRAIGPPEVVSVSGPDDTYALGEAIDVELRFDDVVRVPADSDLALNLRVGAVIRRAERHAGAGTETLTFRYTVQAGDLDEDGVSVPASGLVGDDVRDVHGNVADRAVPPLEDQAKHKVDGVVPAAAVAIASAPATGDTYAAGENIDVALTFNETLTVAGGAATRLALTIGEDTRHAALLRFDAENNRITFRYTVVYGDFDANGVSIQGEALIGGTIKDLAGNDVERTVTLTDQSGHQVDTSVNRSFTELNLTVGGPPGEILLTDALDYAGLYAAPVTTDANVATARVSGHRLIITPVAEGTATITITATSAAEIVLNFPVRVTASPAEVAVLTHTLAAMGRGMLASAANTIGTRLELGPRQRRLSLIVGGRRFDPQGWSASAQSADPLVVSHPGLQGDRRPPGVGNHAMPAFGNGAAAGIGATAVNFDDSLAGPSGAGIGGERMWRGTSFEMPLLGSSRNASWAVWGGGDFASFAGEPDENSYDGSLAAMYLGMDGRGDGWVAGGAVGQVKADASYEYKDGQVSGKGKLDTSLTTLHPYVGWALTEQAKAWVVVGFGTGEASMTRDGASYVAEPTDLSMRMGLVGASGTLGEPGGFDIALRADAGAVTLDTGTGPKAIDELAVSVQRARLGFEMSYTADTGPVVGGVRLSGAGGNAGAVTPFVEVAARLDSGDGPSGTGAEVAAGVRYQSSTVNFEAKARTLAMHGAEGYSETGASATLVVEPSGNRGLRLSVSPRWGGASEATDVFFRRDYAAQMARRGGAERADAAYDEWRMNARVGYGMALRGRDGTMTPFAETDVSGPAKRARMGFSYETQTRSGPVRFGVAGERAEGARGKENRLLLTAEGRF